MRRGLDLRCDVGEIDWDRVRRAGAAFVMLGDRALGYTAQAARAGLEVGVIHTLLAEDGAGAIAEAAALDRTLTPDRERMRMPVACRIPESAAGAGVLSAVRGFCVRLHAAGYRVTVCASDTVCRRLGIVSEAAGYPLYLEFWGSTACALGFDPAMWHRARVRVEGVPRPVGETVELWRGSPRRTECVVQACTPL